MPLNYTLKIVKILLVNLWCVYFTTIFFKKMDWLIHRLVQSLFSAQLCLTLCDCMDCSPPGSSAVGFSRQEHWSGLPCPPPGNLPHTKIEPTSPVSLPLQTDSLPLSQGVAQSTGVVVINKQWPSCSLFWLQMPQWPSVPLVGLTYPGSSDQSCFFSCRNHVDIFAKSNSGAFESKWNFTNS